MMAPPMRDTAGASRRSLPMRLTRADATANAAVPTISPMPAAYAPYRVSPAQVDTARLDVTMARNGPMAQASDARAYAAPNNAIVGNDRDRAGARRGRNPGSGSSRP